MHNKWSSSDGVSEGQFATVLEEELPLIRSTPPAPHISYLLTFNIDACAKLGIKPAITLIIVGKRHHVRFFPRSENEGDRSGNCVAGTVVDSDVINPVEFDFYLLSHGGILGTSRPAHYNVLIDENKFTYVSQGGSELILLSMLMSCAVLTAYNPSRMLSAMCMRGLHAPSPYPHRSIVMPVHCLRIYTADDGLYSRRRYRVLQSEAPLRPATGSGPFRI